MPLEELWTIAGRTGHVRLRHLTGSEVESLLKTFPDLRLVEAQLAAELRWYPRGDYGFWRQHARIHAAEPGNQRPLHDFPDSMCYIVSEWVETATQDQVLLFEQYH
ncbi:hypothetical protein OKA05_25145 [Luteolibacter arcticus]|uniref:Uncharacterized protein n=1 Tax=Luteolibacter arcticus TaxID=1581411 RepID=A0ABT3GQR9_9BACT|nr:hypothetical protein [Luteolibacter arcticus]MCW1925870.1 hypothetical protein [Luteolibacter arcticus]